MTLIGCRLGIDFGTTTTLISLYSPENGTSEVLKIGNDHISTTMPSTVSFTAGTGSLESRAEVAKEFDLKDLPQNYIQSVKRCLGCKAFGSISYDEDPHRDCPARKAFYQDENAQDNPLQPKWCRLDGKIHLIAKNNKEETVTPEYVAYIIVKKAVENAYNVLKENEMYSGITKEEFLSLPVNMGCGARFNLEQREKMAGIAREIGFTNVHVGNVFEEPVLAVIAESHSVKTTDEEKSKHGRTLIYDFGGGSFDVSIVDDREDFGEEYYDAPNVKKREDSDRDPSEAADDRKDRFQGPWIFATDGNNFLGGDDIDAFLIKKVLQKEGISEEVFNLQENSNAKVILANFVKTAKERVSQEQKVSMVISFYTAPKQTKEITFTVTEELLNQALEESKIIENSLLIVKQAAKRAFVYDLAATFRLQDVRDYIIKKLGFWNEQEKQLIYQALDNHSKSSVNGKPLETNPRIQLFILILRTCLDRFNDRDMRNGDLFKEKHALAKFLLGDGFLGRYSEEEFKKFATYTKEKIKYFAQVELIKSVYSNLILFNIDDKSVSYLLDDVILVGGISKIKYVQRKINDLLQRNDNPIQEFIDPVEKVSRGASYKKDKMHFSPCTPPWNVSLAIKGNEESKVLLFEAFEYLDYFKYLYIWDVLSYRKTIAKIGQDIMIVDNLEAFEPKLFKYVNSQIILTDLCKPVLFFENPATKEIRSVELINFGDGLYEISMEIDGSIQYVQLSTLKNLIYNKPDNLRRTKAENELREIPYPSKHDVTDRIYQARYHLTAKLESSESDPWEQSVCPTI